MKHIIEKAKEYKRKVAGSYISITQDDIGSKITGDKVFVSVKIDGEFNLLHFDGKQSFLVNGGGAIKDTLPFLDSVTKLLKSNNINSLTVAAELHIKEDDSRCRVFEVMSAIAKKQDLLVLSVFDILDIDGENYTADDYEEIITKIDDLFASNKKVNSVILDVVNSKEVEEIYNRRVLEKGSEGLVIRIDGMPIIYKLKPIHALDAAVIGFTEGEKNKVRELLLGLLDEDNHYIQIGRVGTGLNEELKSELFETLSKNLIDSSYIEADKRRVAFAMVKPTLVVEVAINELLTENSKGIIKNQLLSYGEENGYSFIASVNGTSLLHPVFKRLRDDKEINSHDIRYKQVTDLVYIDNSSQSNSKELPKSEIIFREVYTKTSKNKTNVQKFIVWKTNKENIDDRYPAYVMNYTNFSPTRGEPINRDVRVSSSKEQILELLQVFKDKNVKKGWELVE